MKRSIVLLGILVLLVGSLGVVVAGDIIGQIKSNQVTLYTPTSQVICDSNTGQCTQSIGRQYIQNKGSGAFDFWQRHDAGIF